jgi:hypothetical protein
VFDQVYRDIKVNALGRWDYSSCFPEGYSGPIGPVVVDSFNWQHDDQLEVVTNAGQLSQPVIDIMLGPGRDGLTRTFSDIYGQNMFGQALNTTLRLGKKYRIPFTIGCWVDQQLGGLPMARKLSSQVAGVFFYYRNRLTSIRHIDLINGPHEKFVDQAQLYVVDLTYEGDVFGTIDV